MARKLFGAKDEVKDEKTTAAAGDDTGAAEGSEASENDAEKTGDAVETENQAEVDAKANAEAADTKDEVKAVKKAEAKPTDKTVAKAAEKQVDVVNNGLRTITHELGVLKPKKVAKVPASLAKKLIRLFPGEVQDLASTVAENQRAAEDHND